MTHHMGMSLQAIGNLLCDNAVQQWFHSHPVIQAAEMLLQEQPVKKALLKARLKKIAPIGGAAEALPPPKHKAVKAVL